jgi:uncharacterized protein YybS (DUF2232 family)
MEGGRMIRFGISLLILGLAGVILPAFDLQLEILSLLDYDTQFIASIILASIGLAMIIIPLVSRASVGNKRSD